MLRALLRRLSSAHAIGLLALVLALCGTAGAALVITGADVRDGSLTGADLAEDTIGPRELQGTRNPGPPSPGPVGPQGPAGPRGPSTVFSTHLQETTHTGGSFTMASLELPPGTYAVHARAGLTAFGYEHVDCSVRAPDGRVAGSHVIVNPPDGLADVTASGVLETAGGEVELFCHRYNVPEQKLRLTSISLMAVQVGEHVEQ